MERKTEEKVRELLQLKTLLASTVLSYSDHKTIEARIERLEAEIKEIIEESD